MQVKNILKAWLTEARKVNSAEPADENAVVGIENT